MEWVNSHAIYYVLMNAALTTESFGERIENAIA